MFLNNSPFRKKILEVKLPPPPLPVINGASLTTPHDPLLPFPFLLLLLFPTTTGHSVFRQPTSLRTYVFPLQIAECSVILNFDVSPITMTQRLLHRAQTSGRVDDNEDTIKKRLDTFTKHSKPVIEHFSDKCKTVSKRKRARHLKHALFTSSRPCSTALFFYCFRFPVCFYPTHTTVFPLEFH